jgi:hypothetical protein
MNEPDHPATSHPAKRIVLAFILVCAVLFLGALTVRPDVLAFPLFAGVIALVTYNFVPNAKQMEERATALRLAQFREYASTVGASPDALDSLRHEQAQLGLSDESVRADMKAVESWRLDRSRAEFIRMFVEEYPSGPSAWGRLEHVARERKLTAAVREHLDALSAASTLARFQATAGKTDELPLVEDRAGLAGKDLVHLILNALYDKRGSNDERGPVVFTNRRLVFGGTRTTAIPWTKVTSASRDGLQLLLQRDDRQTPSVFRFDSLAELLPAEWVSRRLIGGPTPGFVPPPELFKVPDVPERPLLPTSDAASAKSRNEILKVGVGLSLASLILVGGISQALSPAGSPATRPRPRLVATPSQPPPIAYKVAGSPPNAAFVVVTTEEAISDAALLRIARDLHPPNLPPTQVMFWVDATAAPHQLPLTKAQIAQRVGVVSVGGRTGERLVRNRDWRPMLEK